ncbi:hypothetical protein JK361_13360 [Streptomyces sp. 5-8]|uniref:Uncharacterized protein n=1 Tax=Streptomyces musisoli TaxID=2802280 RepID=A0ABS1NZM8_9ACTN|nr:MULTISPECIES: hypothetical protein [Streptomyces]MBL1105563.1 hypothetical protein [Streptomyces musisoli]MBY8843526.1 hypothetical protein [Streptomyces sp. SP2-10]
MSSSSPVMAHPHLPDVARLGPRQQMALDCAVCARPLGASGRVLCELRHRGLLFRLWVCTPGCQTPGPVTRPAPRRS